MDPCGNGTLWHRRVADQGDQTGLNTWVRDDIYDTLVTGMECSILNAMKVIGGAVCQYDAERDLRYGF